MTTHDEEHLRVLRHMLGIDRAREPYRDHYSANAGDPKLEKMRELGLVEFVRPPLSGQPHCTYQTTQLGRELALASAEKSAMRGRRSAK